MITYAYIIAGFVLLEQTNWLNWLAIKLTCYSARKSPMPERLEEEWLAHLSDCKWNTLKLLMAIGTLRASLTLSNDFNHHESTDSKGKESIENNEQSDTANESEHSNPVAANKENVWSLVNEDSTPLIPITGFNAATKRAFDFIFGAIILLLLFPLMALISILIKLDSTGPSMFYQSRSGQNREVIKVYKFRTMYQSKDLRVTRVGAFLRRTNLDELPQLFNVIQGSMSLVGPRPHPIVLDEQFKYVIPALNSRYTVKPGITGWAQIYGLHGETIRISDMVGRIEHDRHYIRNWSTWLDIKIIIMTIFKDWDS